MNKFWMVWNRGVVSMPLKQHPTEEAAKKEAERLSRAHRGMTFVVLEATHAVQVDDCRWTRLQAGEGLPF